MTVSIQMVAQQLQLSPDDDSSCLIQRSLISFLERETHAVCMDIADLQDRYNARSATDLRAKIERGDVYSHPAWEEAIEWEQLEMYLERVQKLLDTLA